MKKQFALGMIIILLFPAFLMDVSASRLEVTDVVWGSVQNPEKAVPGDEKIDLTVVVANIGNKPVCSLSAEISPKLGAAFPFTSWDGTRRLSATFQGVLQAGTSTPLVFKVNIDKDAQPRNYPADLRIFYRDCSSTSDILPQSTELFSINLVLYQPTSPRFIEAKWLVDNAETSVGPSTGQAILEIYIEAPKDSSINNIEGWLTLPEGFESVSKDGRAYATSLQNVPAGDIFRLRFPLVLSEKVELGRHLLPLELKYRNKYGTMLATVLTVPVDVEGRADVAFEISLPSFRANEITVLNYRIYNNGTAAAYNVELNVRSDIPVIRVLQPVYSIGTLKPGQSVSIAVPIFIDKSTEPSLYGVFSRITFKDVFGNVKSKEFNMPFIVEEKFRPGFSVQTSRSYVDSASITAMSLIFTNLNPYDVRDVKISIETTSTQLVIVEGLTNIVLRSLPANGRHITELKVLSTPQAGDSVATIKATIEYKDLIGLTVTESFDLAVAVKANIDIELTGLVLSPRQVTPGETVDVAGDVVNEGSGLARAVTVILSGDHPFKPIGESATFIGTINPSQVSAFTLNFRVAESATTGRYPVKIKVMYRNGFGEIFEVERTLFYEVVTQRQAPTVTQRAEQTPNIFSFAPLLAALAMAVVVPIFVAVRRRSRRETD
ncbi:MAG: hypothetical protein RMI49_04435 [Candidatus Caldarchaeum sp.]|nr:hypothetical protein [Candidatus Caldarchaeum sp.]